MADEIKLNAPSIEQNVNITVTGEDKIRQLGAQLEAAEATIDRLNSTLQSTEEELQRVRAQYDEFAHSNGIDVLQEELSRFKDTATQSVEEFRAFLQAVNLNDAWGTNDWQFEELFAKIRDGSLTASQAIMHVKSEFRALLEESYGRGDGLFDSQVVQEFTASLEHLGQSMSSVLTKIENIEQNGVKATGGTGGDFSQALTQIENSARSMTEEVKEAYGTITSLVQSMTDYANIDSTRVLAVSQAFRNIADIGTGSYGSKSIENIVYLAKQLQAIGTSGGTVRFDLSGFKDFKVSKASLSNLATYLPEIAKVNASKLEDLSKVNLSNFGNIRVSKGSIEGITQLSQAAQALREAIADISKISPDTPDDSEKRKKEANSYDDARRAIREYYEALTLLNKTKSDVTLTGDGYVSTSGSWDELASALNRTKTAFDAVTNSESMNSRSQEEQIKLKQLLAQEQEKYALKSEALANKESADQERLAQKAAERVAREEAAAEASAAAEAKKQEASRMSAEQIETNLLKILKLQDAVALSLRKADNDHIDNEGTQRLQELETELDTLKTKTTAGSISNKDFASSLAKIKLSAEIAGVSIRQEGEKIKSVLTPGTAAFGAAQQELARKTTQAQNALRGFTAAEKSSNQTSRSAYQAIQAEVANYQELSKRLKSGELSQEEFTRAIRQSNGAVSENIRIVKENGDAHQTSGEKIQGAIKKFSQWFSVTRVVMAAWRTIKQMVSTAIELESAFAQLKIVTQATDAEMQKFADTAFELSKNLGQDVTGVTKSIETFSRLGYSLKDATELTKYATILANTAAVSTEEATTGLTSIIKGFSLDVSDSEHIADVLIQVGQKYAVSASEMMEAFERSGAALNATNTSLEKSAGLIAAANAAVQDSSVVGTALKTVSARIRGSKTDLEELGEETGDLANGFSKYAEEIKKLSGFNIMVEGTTDQFKDLYDIMEGISGVWDKLSDTQRARVAEILGGTRQLQVISSIIGNWGDAANAYSDAMNAINVATKANDIYMQTTAAHIKQFKSAFAELSSQLMNSSFLKFFVDFGKGIIEDITALSKFIEKVAALKVLLIAFASTIAMTSAIKLFTLGVTKIISLLKYIIQIIPNAISMWRAYAASNTAAALAEGEAAAGAVTLSSALQASIPVIGLVLAALTALVGTIAICANSFDDSEQKSIDAANTAKDLADEITNLTSDYLSLTEAVKNNEGSKENLLLIQDQLIEKLDIEKNRIQELTEEYGSYSDAIKAASLDKLKESERDIRAGVAGAKDKALGAVGDNSFYEIGSSAPTIRIWGTEVGRGTEESKRAQQRLYQASVALENAGFTITNSTYQTAKQKGWGFTSGTGIDITRNIESVDDINEVIDQLGKALDIIKETAGADSGFYKNVYQVYKSLKDETAEYNNQVASLNANLAEQYTIQGLIGREVPKTKDEFEEYRDAVIEAAKSSGEFRDEGVDVAEIIDDVLKKQSLFADFYKEVPRIDDNLSGHVKTFREILSDVAALFDDFDKIDKIYADILNGDTFDYQTLLGEDFDKAFKDCGEAYDNFVQIIANSPDDIQACQDAFDELVTTYLKQSGVLEELDSETYKVAVDMLRQMGIEVEAGSVATQVLAELVLQKELVNKEEIRTTADVDNLISLANAARATAETIENLNKIRTLTNRAENLENAAQELREMERTAINNGDWTRYESYAKRALNYEKQAAALREQIQSAFESPFEFDQFDPETFKYKGGTSSESELNKSGSTSSSTEKVQTWFEQQYKLHQHLVKMEQETDADYFKWLNTSYQKAYQEGIITLDDYYKYQEEVFKGARDQFKDYLSDIEHEISMRSNYEGETEKIKTLYEKLMDDVRVEIQAARRRGLTDEDDYIQELQKKYESYRKSIADIEDKTRSNAQKAAKELIDIRVKMLKQELADEKDAIKKRIDAIKDAAQQRKDLLREEQERDEYLEDQAEKRKKIADIEAEQRQLEFDDSARAQKRKLELAKELADAQKDLADFEKDYLIKTAEEELDKISEAQQKELEAQYELLEAKEEDAKTLYVRALEDIKNGSIELYNEMISWNEVYGDGIADTITNAWEEAYIALKEYQTLYGSLYEGINLANATGYKYASESWSGLPGASGNDDRDTPTIVVNVNIPTDGAAGGQSTSVVVTKGKSEKSAAGYSLTQTATGYASGTSWATPGLHALDEKGTETIFESSDGNKYKMFTGGEKVLNAKASNFLYKFATGGVELLEKIIRSALGDNPANKIIPIVNNNHIEMGDVVVQGNADKSTVSEIRRAQRDNLKSMLRAFDKLKT